MSVRVKICGVTTVEDALRAVELGADAIGVNLIDSSPRRVSEATAREIRAAVGSRVDVVAVIADRSVPEMRALRRSTGIRKLQLHGDEPAGALSAMLPDAYKAVRVAGPEDVAAAAGFGGEEILVDARVEGALGGTGRTFDWALVQELAATRRLILAGGLTPENVAAAASAVRPAVVDVASGVEVAGRPGRKDWGRVAAFITAARQVGGR